MPFAASAGLLAPVAMSAKNCSNDLSPSMVAQPAAAGVDFELVAASK